MTLFDIPIMGGPVFTMRGRAGLGHVLHHDVAGMKAAHQLRSLVADHGSKPVVFAEGVSRGAGARLLSQAEVDAAYDFALLVERLQGLLHLAVEQHPAVEFDALLGLQILGVTDGRRGRAQVSPDLVVDVSVLVDLDSGKFGAFQAPVGDAVGVLGDGFGAV